jgi:hypothetical protein
MATWQLGWARRPGRGKVLPMKLVGLTTVIAAVGIALAAPANADVDTDFANQLHTYGIYGPRDYNAWLAKITCKRLGNGQDPDAFASASFLSKNLPRTTTTQQTWQFLGAAINTYCPDLTPVLQNAAQQHG